MTKVHYIDHACGTEGTFELTEFATPANLLRKYMEVEPHVTEGTFTFLRRDGYTIYFACADMVVPYSPDLIFTVNV